MLPSNQKYLVFDTETEGLNLFSSKTWQLSWIVCQGNKTLETHDEFIIHKELNIPEVVKKITGFNWDTYNRKAKPLDEVWSKFEKYIFDPQYIVVGQNLLGFDVYMLAVLQRLLGQEPDYSYLPRILDTRALGKAYREERRSRTNPHRTLCMPHPPCHKYHILLWVFLKLVACY